MASSNTDGITSMSSNREEVLTENEVSYSWKTCLPMQLPPRNFAWTGIINANSKCPTEKNISTVRETGIFRRNVGLIEGAP